MRWRRQCESFFENSPYPNVGVLSALCSLNDFKLLDDSVIPEFTLH